MIEEALEELRSSIAKAHEALRGELSKLRTGRANPDLLDGVRIEYYGAQTPLKQLASVAVPEARMLLVKPFDKSQIKAIERAIMENELGLNPQNDGEVIRLPMPALTEERRKELVKLARKHGEEAKVSIRHHRHEAKDLLDSLKAEGEASEDEVERAKKELEDIVKGAQTKVDEIVEKKEHAIMEV
ncbi:MAG: ribosome recycling factor [Myxococcota bacterium]